MKPVVVRFAPSPTGYLHIGGARTAIFNWLFAKKHQGRFILRIEDTDAERSTPDSIREIVDSLAWLGLTWDQGPDFQSRHIKDHLAAAKALLDKGLAYKCFCPKERLDEKRQAAVKARNTYAYDRHCRNLSPEAVARKEAQNLPWALRLKIPEKEGCVSYDDAVYGRIEKQYADLDDFILVRSSGRPLYILSNAVDDIRDRVTHIIRGQDGLANTPKQILIYNALGAPLPVFAHMSLALDPKKAKISKRKHGEMVAVHYYREKGFLPWAMVNFLVLLGWSGSGSKEIYSPRELIQSFDLKGISKTNCVFNINQSDPRFFTDPKILNLNAHYLKSMPLRDLAREVVPFFKKEGLWQPEYETRRNEWFLTALDLLRERFHLLTDFTRAGRAYFSETAPLDPAAVEKHITAHPEMETWLPDLGRIIAGMDIFSEKSLESVLRDFIQKQGLKPAVLVNAVRVAVTGQAKGPDFMKSLMVIGKRRLAARLAAAGATPFISA